MKTKSKTPYPKNRGDFTKMPISKAILTLSIPLILTNIIFTLFQAVDAYWVGFLGKEAVAGIALSFPIFFVTNAIAFGFVTAASAIIAQYKGQNNQEKINYYTTQSMSIATLVGLVLGIIGFFITGDIVKLFGAEQSVVFQATQYLSIILLGSFLLFAYNVLSGALRGIGEVKIFTIFALIGLVLNFIFDPILMFGWFGFPAMGVAGTAWVTLFTELISLLLAFIWIEKNRHIVMLDWKNLAPHKEALQRILKLGTPSAIEFLSRAVGMIAITGIVASFGTIAIAAYGVGFRVIGFALIPSFGISLAINVIIAQYFGAKKENEVKDVIKKGMLTSFLFLTIVSIPILLFPGQLASFFISNEPQVLAEAITYSQLYGLSLGIFGAQIVIVSAYRGSGKTKTAMNLSIASIIVHVVSALILAHFFGLFGLWASIFVSNLIMLLVTYAHYKKNPITQSHI